MPFRLKNAGATYQRLVNQMFNKQIERNMKVYADDMLTKSKEVDNYLDDVKETFKTLRQYKMRLNLVGLLGEIPQLHGITTKDRGQSWEGKSHTGDVVT